MKRIAIMQPGYLPWLGFFELMASSDILVIYDDVQFVKHSWQNRNRIKNVGGAQFLTIPVLIRGKNRPKINEVLIAEDVLWRRKHLKSISYNYCKAKYFDEIFPIIEKGLQLKTNKLLDINMFFIREIAKYLNINTQIALSSDFGITAGGTVERVINICKYFNATHFYNGPKGKELYKDEKEDFAKQGIVLEIQEYQHPEYPQLFGEFIPYLSVIDLLFNRGKHSLEIILSGKNISYKW